MQTLKESIIEILIKSKQLSKAQLEKALEIQKARGMPLRKVLVEEGMINEETLLSLLSEQLYVPTLHLKKYKFDPDVVKVIPERMARLYQLIPLSRIGNTLTVAMSDPLNIFALDDLKALTGCQIDTVLSSEEEVGKAIDTQYHIEAKDIQQILDESSFRPSDQEQKKLNGSSSKRSNSAAPSRKA